MALLFCVSVIAEAVELKFGGQIRRAGSEYRYANVTGREFLEPDGSVGVALDTTAARLDPTTIESSLYVAARVRPYTPLTLEIGARYDHRTHTSDSDVSPRLQAALDLGERTTLRGSIGAYRQSHGVEELSVVIRVEAHSASQTGSHELFINNLPNRPLDRTHDRMPNRTPNRLPDRLPDRIHDQIPAMIPNRLPDFLPVIIHQYPP